ncbi:MAG: hypothetical protein LBK03_00870 [Bacteroidales bacterium]|jgi:hypothetical protein|nr:hypothetical protein [Bacteroidales bacterium]
MQNFNLLLIALLLLCLAQPVAAQSEADTVHIRETTMSNMYYYHNVQIKHWQVGKLLASSPKASILWERGKTCITLACLLGVTGGVLIGWPIGTYMASDTKFKQRWWLVSIGAGAIGGTVALVFAGKRNFTKAVKRYNRDIRLGSPAVSCRVEASPMMMSFKVDF